MKVLLTATVTPQVTRSLHLKEPLERRRQYVESLRVWVPVTARHGATLVVFENSGEDLAALARDAVGAIPAHLCLVNAEPPSEEDVKRGKGAAEAAMMDEFAEMMFGDPDELWFKCTGRLSVRNFDKCIPGRIPSTAIVGRTRVNMLQMDTRFFGATAAAWHEYFRGVGPCVHERDGQIIERILMQRVLSAMSAGVPLIRFRTQPSFHGRSGTWAGRRYDTMPSRLKRVGADQLERVLRSQLATKFY